MMSFTFPRRALPCLTTLLLLACGDDGGSGGAGGQGSTSTGASTTSNGTSTTSTSTTTTGSTATTTTGAGGAAAAQAECDQPNECQLIDDCCTCAAIPNGEPAPPCAVQDCLVSKCTELGLPPGNTIQCNVRHCTAAFDCDQSQVVCLQPTPVCPAGFTPSVQGACWGPCVPAEECAFVSDCGACTPTVHACVHRSIGPTERLHCVPLPEECGGMGGTATCACMGEAVCGGIPCTEQGGELSCQTQ